MRVTPTDYIPGMIEHARRLHEVRKQDIERGERRTARHVKEQSTKHRRDLELDKMYLEKGLVKTRLIKGMNVDVYA
jgi:hypothetical protein